MQIQEVAVALALVANNILKQVRCLHASYLFYCCVYEILLSQLKLSILNGAGEFPDLSKAVVYTSGGFDNELNQGWTSKVQNFYS